MVNKQGHRTYRNIRLCRSALVFFVYCGLILGSAWAQGPQKVLKPYVPSKDEVMIGQPEAPVIVVEFSSFTCLHCAQFHENVYKRLYEPYIASGLVGYVMVPFPMDAIALRAVQLAMASGLKSYPRMADLIFSKQKEWLFSKNPFEKLEALVLKAGISVQAMKNTLKNKEFLKTMLENCLKAHKEFGINKTPAFMVNGKVIEGALSFEAFENLIKEELEKKTAK